MESYYFCGMGSSADQNTGHHAMAADGLGHDMVLCTCVGIESFSTVLFSETHQSFVISGLMTCTRSRHAEREQAPSAAATPDAPILQPTCCPSVYSVIGAFRSKAIHEPFQRHHQLSGSIKSYANKS